MIVVNKNTGKKYIVASIIDICDSKLYKLEDYNGNKSLVDESKINSSFNKIEAASQAVDYFKELDLIKDRVLERINKINEVLRWTDARKNTLDKSTPEYQKIDSDEQKYKEDLKYYQKVLETVKDKIVDFQSLQSRVSLERQIDLNELYNSIGLSPEKLEQKEVDVFAETPSKHEEEVKEVTTETEQ